ncbi:MAG: polysaccharide deacetylase family protein [Candidatus Cryptobacteroides sp.]|jgi:peptidoglycan/xylan/chitin deacetylase (PgdA/CDA1 family)
MIQPLSFYIHLIQDKILRFQYKKADCRYSRNISNGSAIIMFHHVGEHQPSDVSDSCFSSIGEFKTLLEWLKKNKRVVPIDVLYQNIVAGVIPDNEIVLTFDDVPSNFFSVSARILKEYGMPYTIYIATGFLNNAGYLSKDELITLSKESLCTVGSHTVSHYKLREKGVDVQDEIRRSKLVLEQLINKEVVHFAYPYGTPFAVSSKNVKVVQASRLYHTAVSTIPGYINNNTIQKRYFLPRIHSRLFTKEFIK